MNTSPDTLGAQAPNANQRFHEALIDAAHGLEAALAAPSPGRELPWKERVASQFKGFREILSQHIGSTESSGGLLGNVEKIEPAFHHRIQRLVREHADLLRQTQFLEEHLAPPIPAAPFDVHDVRQRAGWLLTALRHHQALEADLVFELYDLDLGGGD